jgi:iron complex outermembrane recepter protein
VRRVGDRFKLDLNAYQFNLRETIVRRTNEAGAEFFVNAGQTDQKGLEWRLDYPLLKNVAFLDQVAIWNAGTLVSYEYQSYQQGATDFTGNKLPGIPSFTQNTGLDILMKAGFAAYFTYQYVDGMYLNDANTVEVPSFNQFLVRVSWNRKWGRHLTTELSASGEWVNADIYSLGYDLNAFGNRYYNAAPKQNLWVGVKAGWVW